MHKQTDKIFLSSFDSIVDPFSRMKRTARGLQYSGPAVTLRVQYGLQIQYNTIQSLVLNSRGKNYICMIECPSLLDLVRNSCCTVDGD